MLNGRIYYVCYYIYNFKKKFKNSSSKINFVNVIISQLYNDLSFIVKSIIIFIGKIKLLLIIVTGILY